MYAITLFAILCPVLFVPIVRSTPVDLSGYFNEDAEENSTQIVELENSNGTKKDLYVIKTIVYEVAVLADPDDDDDNSTEDGVYTQEKVDLTFYNARGNGTHIDLGDIPIPYQTNISGHVVTGITPVHAGTIPKDTEQLAALLPEGATVTLTNSDNATGQTDMAQKSDEYNADDFKESSDGSVNDLENGLKLDADGDLIEKLKVIHDVAEAL